MERRFFFLVAVWGNTYVDNLLTFCLPTLLSPGNIPGLPNLSESQFTIITTQADEQEIRQSSLFATLSSLIRVEFILMEISHDNREEKYSHLGHAFKRAASQALGKGQAFFVHPNAMYSEGMLTHLYRLSCQGRRVCVSHGPVVSKEKLIPYLSHRKLCQFDKVTAIQPRAMVKILMDNLHTDMSNHDVRNPFFPENPYMGLWRAPNGDGALFRFVSLHPYMVDLSRHDDIPDFTAIDHDFVRANGFVLSDIHIENDSDNFLVIGIKPENEHNAHASQIENDDVESAIINSTLIPSNCMYSIACFMNGIRVHSSDLDKTWHQFEEENFAYVNGLLVRGIARGLDAYAHKTGRLPDSGAAQQQDKTASGQLAAQYSLLKDGNKRGLTRIKTFVKHAVIAFFIRLGYRLVKIK